MPPRESHNLPRAPLFWLLLAVLLSAGVAMRLAHFKDVDARGPDELVYSYFASRIAREGFSAVPSLFASYEANVPSRFYPGPTRFGHLIFFAAAIRITGDPTARSGAVVSLVCSILSLVLCAWIGLRFFTPEIALLAVTFLGSSVGELGMSRRAWQDMLFGFASFLLVYITCEITRRARDWRLYTLFYGVGIFCLMTKENAVIPYGLCALWLLGILLWQERSWRAATAFAVAGLTSIAISLGAFCVLAGSPRLAFSVLDHALRHQTGDPSNFTVRCCSGPWYQFSYLLWIVGPVVTAAALFGLVIALSRRPLVTGGKRPDSRIVRLCGLITVGVWSFASFYPNIQNLRMFSPADGTFCLLAGFAVWHLISRARHILPRRISRVMAVLLVMLVVLGALRDYGVFRSVVVQTDMQELPAIWIRQAMRR
jgi:hypothetical protein